MMSRYRQKTVRQMLENLWKRKIQNIIQKFPTKETSHFLNAQEVETLLSDFASKQSDVQVEISSVPTEQKIVTIISFTQWPDDRITLSIQPVTAFVQVYVVCRAGLEEGVVEVSTLAYNADIERTLKNVSDFIKKFPKYREQAERMRNAKERTSKIQEMGRKSIATIIPQMMNASGYEWSLYHNDIRYVLYVKMKMGKMLELSLTPNNFASKMSDLIKVVAQMEKLFDEIPYAVDVKNCSSKIQWQKGGKVVA